MSFATFASVSLIGAGELSRRFVGLIYYSKEHDAVKISHLTFLGRRADKYYRVEDIVSLGESPEDPNNFIWRKALTDGCRKVVLASSKDL